MLYRLCRALANLLCRVFFKIEVKGREKIPQHTALILASNHVSYLDPIVVGAFFPGRLNFLAKEELFKNAFFGSFLSALGVVPLKRDKTDVAAVKIALRLLKQGKPVLIFPEGQRGNLENVKAGVGFLFKKSSVPIAIVRIFGTDKAWPKGQKRIRFNKIRVIFDRMDEVNREESYETISCRVLEKIKGLVYR